VVSKRGPGGGYLLARPADEISVADIAAAIQGSVVRGAEEKEPEAPGFIWECLTDRVGEALQGITVAGLCQEARERGLPRAAAPPLMYEI